MGKRSIAERDPSILDKIIAVIGVGAGREAAAAEAEISAETLRVYIRDGRDAWLKHEAALETGGEPKLSEREEFFRAFYVRVRKADTKTKAYSLKLINKAAEGDWKAGAWLMEKLYPKEFGYGIRVDFKVDEELSNFLARLERNLDAETFERVLRASNGEVDRREAASDRAPEEERGEETGG